MDELYSVGQKVAQDNAGVMDPELLSSALGGSPEKLAELLAGGGSMEEYLQSYEQMLQEGVAPTMGGGAMLDQVDPEGGITTRPEAGFVVKTRDNDAGTKIFINVVSSPHIEEPHMKSYTELDGEQGCRVPLSIGVAVEDFDKKGEPCVTYDVVANPKVVEECSAEPAFREQVVQLCLAAVSQKYKLQLDQRFKLPKIKYKGTTVQLQRIRKKKESQIQEMPENTSAPQPGTSAQRRASGEPSIPTARTDGPQPPDFCVYYALPDSSPLQDIFERDWGSPPDDVEEASKVAYLYGFDLPCYRVNTFQEKIRGTMKNKADRERDEAEEGEVDAVARARKATSEMLASRTCCVHVRMPDLDPQIPSLKQFSLEVSDECLRVSFPMLPRSTKSAYANITFWWPQHFNSLEANADWDPKADLLMVSLPADSMPGREAASVSVALDTVS
mmetsp:Transcript_46905/g.109612  ORF Transcript_46905/g.109612 Transcript_46905/m.109612 type:complete len:444 (-) Transcript_46905:54-1385(-)